MKIAVGTQRSQMLAVDLSAWSRDSFTLFHTMFSEAVRTALTPLGA
jgi:hypothetical protein